MNSRRSKYPGAQGNVGLWRRKLWRMAAMAYVKLLAVEAVRPTREGGNPVCLQATGGCQSIPLTYKSPVKIPACWFHMLARQSLSSEAAEEIATKHFRYTCERRVLL